MIVLIISKIEIN